MSTTRSDPAQAAPARPGQAVRAAWRRTWPGLSVLVGAVLWWPAGFWGLEPWLQLPLEALRGDELFLGAVAAAASVSLVVRSAWPRFLIVLVFSGLGWVLSAPATDRYADERQVLAVLLVAGAFLGIVLGARGSRGPLGAATVLAVVAGVSPATWPHGLPLAVGLALPFAVATWQRVAPTVVSVLRILVTWLVFALLAKAASYGWDTVRPGMGAGSRAAQVRLVAEASWDFVRTQWWSFCEALLRSTSGWFWLAVVLAVLIAATRALLGVMRRRSAPARG